MTTTLFILRLTACIAAAGALPLAVHRLLARRLSSLRPIELVPASLCVSFLIIIGEFQLLTLIPIDRPLELIPFLHVALLLALGWAALRTQTTVSPLRNAKSWLTEQGPLTRLLALALALYLGVAFIWGCWEVPWAWDGLSYHIPMAVQPYQDGFLGLVDSDLPWAAGYPRGVELVWSWTLFWLGSDLLFNAVQWLFGIQLLAAVWMAASRLGAGPRGRLYAVLAVATAPIYYVLAVASYNDLATAAGIVTMTAHALPPKRRENTFADDFLVSLLALAQCALVKLPFAAGVFLLVCLLFYHFRFRRPAVPKKFITAPRALAVAASLALASVHYLRNWIVFANPVYPLRIKLAGFEIFPGPHAPDAFVLSFRSSLGDPASMSLPGKVLVLFADLLQPLSPDSMGGFGPLFLFLVLPCAALFFLAGLAKRNWYAAFLGLTLAAAFAIPNYTMPRYALTTAALLAAAAAVIWDTPYRRLGPVLRLAVIAGCVTGAAISADFTKDKLLAYAALKPKKVSLAARPDYLHEYRPLGVLAHYPTPRMIRELRRRSPKGDTLAWDVETFHTLLYNREYSNKVIYLPASQNSRWPNTVFKNRTLTPQEKQAWLTKIADLKPNHILLYTNSDAAKALRQSPLPYKPAYTDPPTRAKARMTLFERKQ